MIRRCLITSAWLLIALGPATPSPGQGGAQPKYKVLFEQGPAYVRVTVTTDPAVPVKRTENFQVVCGLRGYQGVRSVVYRDLEIPQGKTSGSTELYTPGSNEYWMNWVWSIHVEQDNNGLYDRRSDLCRAELDHTNNSYGYHKQTLIVSSNIVTGQGEQVVTGGLTPARRQKTQVTGTQPIPNIEELNPYFSQFSGGGAGTTVLNNYSMFTAYPGVLGGIPLGSLPTDWMGLYNVEMILISLPDLQQACDSDPRVRDALRHWLAMGGNLVVNDCGNDLARAPEIMPTLFGPQSSVLPQQMQAIWAVPTKKLKNYISRNFTQMVNASVDVQVQVDAWQTTDQLEQEYWAMAPYLQGHIFAVSDDMSKTTTSQWREMINAHNVLKGDHFELDHNHADYDRQLLREFDIPSIGDPPVLAFQLLLILFVILVGPVFFLFFRRAKKLHLLLFATPLLSLVVCLGMFLFAILNDGFSRQGRVHTITFLDQSTGEGVSFARHAFYAGTQPPGYLFGNKTLVLDSRRENSLTSRFRFRGDQVMLSGGDIKPRTKHQVVTHQPIETGQQINLVQGQPSATVQNRMDTDIVLFCAPTRSGWQVAHDVPAGQSARCRMTDFRQVQREIGSVLEQQSTPRPRFGMNSYGFNEQVLVSVPAGRSAEHWIKKFIQHEWDKRDFVPGQYIAILKQPLTSHRPDAEVDYKTHELHIVIGKQ